MAEFDTNIQTPHSEISGRLWLASPSDERDVEVLAVIDTEQYTVEARQTDSLIRVRMDGEEALVHNEFQTT